MLSGSNLPAIRWRRQAVKRSEQTLEESFGIVTGAATFPSRRRLRRQSLPAARQIDQCGTDADRREVVGSYSCMAEPVQFHVHPGAGRDQNGLVRAHRLQKDVGGPDVVDRGMVRHHDSVGVGQQAQIIGFGQVAGEKIHVGQVLLPTPAGCRPASRAGCTGS